jgi:hypothetical protein
LRLDDDQHAYLFELAGKENTRPRRRTTQRVRPQLQQLLDQLTESPAIVQGRRLDILAWNPLAAALVTDFAAIPEGSATTCGCSSPTRKCGTCTHDPLLPE